MPKFDGTGPQGQGPRTGWGMGPCGGGMGCGRGFGFGQGTGGGRRFFSKKEESEILDTEVEDLEAELKAIKERLGELKG